jgi:hypothetical protein
MVLVLVAVAAILIVVAGIKASEHLRHPENIDPSEAGTTGSEALDSSRGSDRPAEADAEDPPTEVPNRARTQPPSSRT